MQLSNMENENKLLKEKKHRSDFVLGILLAAALGFVINVLANLYYDLFIAEIIKWADINKYQLLVIVATGIFVIGFLFFLVNDYKNEIDFKVGFIKRFLNFFFYKFTIGRIITIMVGLYLILFSILLLIISYIGIAKQTNYYIATIIVVLMLVARLYINRKSKKKKWVQN